MAAIFAYPVASLGFSMLGVWDFVDATTHLLHGRVKQMIASTFTGGIKLGFTILVISMITDPIFKSSARNQNTKPGTDPFSKENFDAKSVAQALQSASYKKDSEAEKVSSFCKYYFKDSHVSNYDVTQSCIYPLLHSAPDGFKEWVLEDPLNRAARLSSAVEGKGLSYKFGFSDELIVVSDPLRNCTAAQISLNQVYNASSSTTVPVNEKSLCDQQRIKFLDFVFSQPNLLAAKKIANLACAQEGIDQGCEGLP